jgi:hypothetical protein
MDPSEERRARAQVIFRAGNEALRRAAGSRDGALPFLCECSDETCFTRVPLVREEYEEVRAHPRRFVVALGHEGEAQTVARRDGYAVIEKDAAAGEIAVETDPRGEERS